MLSPNSNTDFFIQSVISNDIDHLGELVKPWNLYLRKLDRVDEFRTKIETKTPTQLVSL